jgi:hypothetical protein
MEAFMAFNLVRYSQQDPQWKSSKIGNSSDTIGHVGCALTSVAMYASGWGFAETPQSLNKKLASAGGFYGAAIVWDAISKFHPQIRNKGVTLCRDSDAPLAEIDASLASGQPVLVEVDNSPAAGPQTHWVVLYEKKGLDYLMLDPWPYPVDDQPVLLRGRYSYGKPLKRTITAVSWYEYGGGGAQPPAVETNLFVQVLASATAGLRLRAAPNLEAPTLTYESAGARLHVIEAEAAAQAKIGVANQWVRVRDPQELEGYVAAWYLEKAASAEPSPPIPSTPPPPTPPAPVPEPDLQKLDVLVSKTVGTAGLRLRKFPSVFGALVAIERAGARLTVLEKPEKAKVKVGRVGQWLNVRDPNGRRGYVMAQYVQFRG